MATTTAVVPQVRTVACHSVVVALAAVFVVIKKMKPRNSFSLTARVEAGWRWCSPADLRKVKNLMTELHCSGEGGSKETHTIMMLGVLFVSIATVQLGEILA
jgi:hypothetical protein